MTALCVVLSCGSVVQFFHVAVSRGIDSLRERLSKSSGIGSLRERISKSSGIGYLRERISKYSGVASIP